MNENTKTAYAALTEEDQTFIRQAVTALKYLSITGEDKEGTRLERLTKVLKLTDRFSHAPAAEVEAFIKSLPLDGMEGERK